MEIHYTDNNHETQDLLFEELLKNKTYSLIYFYPKDDTPGCSLEAKDFNSMIKDFDKLGVQVIGVSKDSLKSHCSFQKKYALSIPLISDEKGLLTEEFAVLGEKKMYGKVYKGIIRSTFLLDSNGIIIKERRNVNATGHAKEILDNIKEFLG